MKAELVPLNGDPPIPITRDVSVVGRREFCDVRIDHESLSKRHCVLVRTDGLLMLRDLATTNGTKVNGQRVSWAALLPNDRLTMGGYKVRVYLGPDDAPGPSEQAKRQAVSSQPATSARRPAGADQDRAGFATPTPDPEVVAVDDDVPILLGEEDVVLSQDVSLKDLVQLDEDDIIDLR